MPLDLLFGWMFLWGVVAPLAAPRASLIAVGACAAIVDVFVMPLCAPLVALGPTWLVGELVAIAIALGPGLLLARWTAQDRRLPARAFFQMMCFAALTLVILPGIIFAHTDGSWSALADGSARTLALQLQVVAIPALLGISAVQEFVERGHGTPLPFDAPRRLVTTGPYAYVANPMQLSAALLLLTWGAVLHSWWIALGGVMSWIYGVGLADDRRRLTTVRGPGDGNEGSAKLDSRWRARPRALYVRCRRTMPQIERGSRARGVSLSRPRRVIRRETARITYELVEDPRVSDEGVGALARAAEHINLAWAMLGFFVRLPLLRQWLQLLADVSGGDEKLVSRSSAAASCPIPEGPASAS